MAFLGKRHDGENTSKFYFEVGSHMLFHPRLRRLLCKHLVQARVSSPEAPVPSYDVPPRAERVQRSPRRVGDHFINLRQYCPGSRYPLGTRPPRWCQRRRTPNRRRIQAMVQILHPARKHLKNTCPQLDVVADDDLDGLKTAGNEVHGGEKKAQLLKTYSVTTWEEFVEYLRNLRETMQNISKCVKEVKEIETSTLLTIEAERQREIFEGIKELRNLRPGYLSPNQREYKYP
ncbi:hypothetical protein DFH08DRAFT_929162 [Mycena albidolilacea]|uniref:Uncharacterized protein n=1 Tax=Mycena albidolilacea TaxID=1033008 RepID=A0AAD7ARJ0_9AGAR|nr:hypothetical protein DFH08DRAFT_929162 [Mycena albidolilacea]